MKKILLTASLALVALVSAKKHSVRNDRFKEAEVDLVKTLPGMPDIGFGMYSGYVPINGTKKSFHYIAALSQRDPVKDPVVFWYNGGPGCSSLLGFLQENGPYYMDDFTSEFVKNNHTWNKEATVIFMEAPAGVGFSLCPDASECHYTDNSTAVDNLVALINLFEMKFPALKGNDLYLSGESYAGIYVPTLALQID